MATEWYYVVNKQKRGPVPSLEIRRLAGLGVIKPDTLIWKEGLADWIVAKSIKGLFPSPSKEPDEVHFFQAVSPREYDRSIVVSEPVRLSVRSKDEIPIRPILIGIGVLLVFVLGLAIFGQLHAADNGQKTLNPINMIIGVVLFVAALVIGLLFYVLPSIIATKRKHHNRLSILAVNLLLGWTFLGWVAALVWALSETHENVQKHFHHHSNA